MNVLKNVFKNVLENVFMNVFENVLKNVLENVFKNVLENVFKNVLKNVLERTEEVYGNVHVVRACTRTPFINHVASRLASRVIPCGHPTWLSLLRR